VRQRWRYACSKSAVTRLHIAVYWGAISEKAYFLHAYLNLSRSRLKLLIIKYYLVITFNKWSDLNKFWVLIIRTKSNLKFSEYIKFYRFWSKKGRSNLLQRRPKILHGRSKHSSSNSFRDLSVHTDGRIWLDRFGSDPDQKYIYFMGSERLPITCYVLSVESNIPCYSTSN